MRQRLQDVLRSLADAVRGGDGEVEALMALIQDPAQRAILDRVTAVMSLVEARSKYDMDGVGPDVVPTVHPAQALRPAPQGPRTARPRDAPAARAGAKDEAVRRRPVSSSARSSTSSAWRAQPLWEGPANLPRIEKLTAPALWVERVLGHQPSPPDPDGRPAARRRGRADSGPKEACARRRAAGAGRVQRGADSVALAAALAFEARDAGVPRGRRDRRPRPAARFRGAGREDRRAAARPPLDPVLVLRVSVGTDGGPEGAARLPLTPRRSGRRGGEGHDARIALGHALDDQAETVLRGS